jgi:hypothetical protein
MLKALRKINLPATLSLVLSLGIMSGTLMQRSAYAGRTDVVPAFQIKLSKNNVGRYLQVIYAVGRPAFIGVSSIPLIDIIRPESKSVLITSETFTVPTVEIEKTPLRGSYNMVVFTISNDDKVNWVNENDTSKAYSPNYEYLMKLSKPDIDGFVLSHPGEAFTVNL